MIDHTRNLALVTSPALSPREKSASAVALALGVCPAGIVASRLGLTQTRVRQWTYPDGGSPRLDQILASPERFAVRLLAAAGQVYAPACEVIEVPPRERLWLLTSALGALLATTPRGLDSLDQYSDDELTRRDRSLADIEEQVQRERQAIARVRMARTHAPREDKGASR